MITTKGELAQLVADMQDGDRVTFEHHSHDGRLLRGLGIERRGSTAFYVSTDGDHLGSMPYSLIGGRAAAVGFAVEVLRLVD